MKKMLLAFAGVIMLGPQLYSQNVGIGTNNPQTKLQVEGAISSTPASGTPSGGAVTIPANVSVFRILDDAANTPITVTATSPKEGQYLSIYNADITNSATFGGQTIAAANGVASFNYINGGWRTVSNTKAGGDLSGTYPNPLVVKIQGQAVSNTAPTNGQVLKYNTTTSQYEPSADLNSGGTVGSVSANAPLSATPGSNPVISLTGVVPVANGGTGSSTTPSNGQILIGNGTGFGINTISSTNNQTTITNGAGTIQFGTVQDINTSSSPSFTKVSATGANINSFDATGSVRIGSTTANPSTAGAGAVQYNGGNVQYSDGTTWKTLSTGGTVTSVSVNTVNGVSGTVTNATTTPAISLTLGAITPSSVAATGSISASNFSGSHSGTSSGTNTGDQTNISGNAATVTTNANLTGPITSVGNATSIASQTGTGTTFAMSASPTFTGAPTLPTGTIGVTQSPGNNSTALATTAFVTAANGTNANLTGMVTSVGNATTVVTNANLTGPITSVGNTTSIASQTGTGSTFAMSASPTFTGTPTLPTGTIATTQSAGNNSTAIATTAFVTTAVSGSISGTTNTIPKFTGANTLGNSTTTDDGTTVTTSSQFDVTGGAGTVYTTAPIEVRTTLTPRISFHWPGIVASQIGMDASGVIRTYNNPGTAYEQFAASNITANGVLKTTGDIYNNAWYRGGTADDNFTKMFGNSRQMVFRTDGTTQFSDNGAYPFVWLYGGDNSGNRRMILDNTGNIWTNTYGWLHNYFALASHTHPWSQVTSKPAAWLDAANLIQDNANFNNSVPSGFYQGFNSTNAPGTSWYNMINVRHSNTGNDHGFQIAASYYDEKIWTRTYQGGNGSGGGAFTPWAEMLTSRSTSNTNWALSANLSHSSDDWCTGCAGTGALADLADDATTVVTMPFSLTINGTSYSQLSICSNGWVAFGNTSSASLGNTTIPTSTIGDIPVIYAYWDDLKDFGSGESVRYGYVGTSPNQVYLIDYNMRPFTGSGGVHFQVLIHEGSGLINVKYRDAMDPTLNGQSASIGFQVSGSKGYPIVCNGKVLDDNRDDSEGWSVCPVR